MNDPAVRNNPGLNELEINSIFDSNSVGLEYRVKITAFNIEGETDSDVANIILGDVPLAPT